MKATILMKKDLDNFVCELKEEFLILGPRKKRSQHVFSCIDDVQDLDLGYLTTILPPKKLFFPPRDTILLFDRVGESVSAQVTGCMGMRIRQSMDMLLLYLLRPSE